MAAKSSCCPSPPIRNLRYSLLRGPPALEPHQRAHRVAARIVGDVHAHQAPRHPLQAQVAAQRIDRVLRPLLGLEGLDPQALQQVTRVLLRQHHPAVHDAALRQRPVGGRFQFGQQVELRRRERQHHRASPAPRRAGSTAPGTRSGSSASSTPSTFSRNRCSRPTTLPSRTRSSTATASSPSRANPITSASPLPRISTADVSSSFSSQRSASRCSLGALEVLPLRRDRHLLPHPEPDVLRPALQELEHLVDHPAIVFLGLPADARRLASADVVVEAGPVPPLARNVVGTAAHRVDAAHDRQRPAQLGDVRERAEVARPLHVAPARDQHPRERLPRRHRDRGIALVVLQPHVEPRPVFLDQVVLEQQRLRLVGRHHGLDVGDEAAEQDVLRLEAIGSLEK